MKIAINQLLNSSILNSEWVGFHGDSEYADKDGEIHFGYWTFLGIVDNTKGEVPFDLDDEIPEEMIYYSDYIIIKNKKGNICVVKFHYRRD